jgi:hypothetical protein
MSTIIVNIVREVGSFLLPGCMTLSATPSSAGTEVQKLSKFFWFSCVRVKPTCTVHGKILIIKFQDSLGSLLYGKMKDDSNSFQWAELAFTFLHLFSRKEGR